MRNSKRYVVIFDGSCNFCTASAELLRIVDWRHRLRCVPFQLPGVPQIYGLTIAQCEQAVWVVTPDGCITRGAQAVSVALDAILGVPLFQWLYALPGMQRIEDTLYTWVVKYRRFFPGIQPYCQRPDVSCD